MKPVVVVIPIYKAIPNELENCSFLNCLNILRNHPIYIVAPKLLDLSFYTNINSEITIIRFEDYYFESIQGYNQLMLSKKFYSSFLDFEFILIHQLDAYVFRDDLIQWCTLNYDFIGAPVFNFKSDIYSQNTEVATLNGGLSLRKTKTAISVLNSFHLIYPFKSLLQKNWEESKFKGIIKALYFFLFGNNTYHLFNSYDRNEDIFWAIKCQEIIKNYKVPEVGISVKFSIDNYPERAFEIGNNTLPFGCHAFDKNIEFWKKYLTLLDAEKNSI
jgi:hypothetical protein